MSAPAARRADPWLMQGDNGICLHQVPADSVQLTVTSPPYDNLRTYETGAHFDLRTLGRHLHRVTRPGGVVVWVVADAIVDKAKTLTSFTQALFLTRECGFQMHDVMIWNKGGFTVPPCLQSKRYADVFEYMFVLSKGSPSKFRPLRDRLNKGGPGAKGAGTKRLADGSCKKHAHTVVMTTHGYRFNVWDQPAAGQNPTDHPATFPLALARAHVHTWSDPRDTVLDPFMGSGTTGLACAQMGRRFIGIERNADYLEMARGRIGAPAAVPCG